FGRGEMVGTFEDTAFSLQAGKLSDPVKSRFGYHLILVEEIRPERIRPLDDVKVEIHDQIFVTKAQDVVYERSVTLEDQLYASGDLKAISKDLNLRIKDLGPFSRQDEKLDNDVERKQAFINAAFTTPKGEVSNLIDLQDGRFLAMKILDHVKSRNKTFDEAKEELLTAYRAEQTKKIAQEQMTATLEKLQAGESWDTVTKDVAKATTEKPEAFTMSDRFSKTDRTIRQAAFQLLMERPLYPELVEHANGITIVRLDTIIKPNLEDLDKQKAPMQARLQQNLGRELFSAMITGLIATSEITVDRTLMDRL
ncbi:MAG: peptidyl-prolyl cis-trans isomerase, partial [Magnetococcales bacterium]|nr:peptidyl-prolyl cis-trans isomerase [Magnetococcales bacterium]